MTLDILEEALTDVNPNALVKLDLAMIIEAFQRSQGKVVVRVPPSIVEDIQQNRLGDIFEQADYTVLKVYECPFWEKSKKSPCNMGGEGLKIVGIRITCNSYEEFSKKSYNFNDDNWEMKEWRPLFKEGYSRTSQVSPKIVYVDEQDNANLLLESTHKSGNPKFSDLDKDDDEDRESSVDTEERDIVGFGSHNGGPKKHLRLVTHRHRNGRGTSQEEVRPYAQHQQVDPTKVLSVEPLQSISLESAPSAEMKMTMSKQRSKQKAQEPSSAQEMNVSMSILTHQGVKTMNRGITEVVNQSLDDYNHQIQVLKQTLARYHQAILYVSGEQETTEETTSQI
eukprot:Gb_39339 [translate_table: standard]